MNDRASRTITLLVAPLLLAGGCATAEHAGFTAPRSPQLAFADDESTLERDIGVYLEGQGIKVQWRGEPNDVWLLTAWEPVGAAPGFVVIIDTLQSSVAAGVVKERAVLLRLETRYLVPSDQTATVLARLNAHHATNWAGSWYVNPNDRELEGTWALNIPTEVSAIEAGLVHDALVRIVVSWRELAATLDFGVEGPSRTF